MVLESPGSPSIPKTTTSPRLGRQGLNLHMNNQKKAHSLRGFGKQTSPRSHALNQQRAHSFSNIPLTASPAGYHPRNSPVLGSASSANIVPPFIPSLSPAATAKAAMESTLQRERQRRVEKEAKEKSMTADELRAVLKDERVRMSRIAAELASLKSNAVQSQLDAEVHEEGRINCL